MIRHRRRLDRRATLGPVRTILGAVTIAVLAAGCGGVDASHVTAAAVVPLDEAPLTDAAAARVVGVGEATHGNKEFVQVRKLIIQKLVREHGFRTVALEADFGGTAAAADYVMGGRGSAEDAAKALGFDIYRTRETADLLKWLHDHNETAADRDKVHLYGFDLQRYDHNKQRLLSYLAEVDPAQVKPVRTALADLTDANRQTLSGERLATAAKAAEQVVTQLKAKQQAYERAGVKAGQQAGERADSKGERQAQERGSLEAGRRAYAPAGSAGAFALALHHAETIQRSAQLQTSGTGYARKRDAWMAANITWIADREAAQGRKKVIVAGHDGHIDKSGAAFSFPSMGPRLAETYGDDYFAIGTDFGTSTFISRDDGSGERRRFTVTHDAPLAKLFGREPMGYLNLAEAVAADPANRRLLASEVPMGSVGDGFRSVYTAMSWTYTVKTVPTKAYDAVVFVPKATPVSPL
ncbi:erythromycin esterase family protein [Nonomuraea sp. NPDC049419]|uniref:erythromycin esterase family protein n=1 Tax=Nonomuraea sp. NPDC049419 TaxID=3155772 RepID=UPI003413230B